MENGKWIPSVVAKISRGFLIAVTCSVFHIAFPIYAASIFSDDNPIVDGLPVHDMSSVFAEIYEKLDNVKWDGKDIRIAIESIESTAPFVKVAATDERIFVLYKDDIVGNWPRPKEGDWVGFGEITTAIVLRIRENDPKFAKLDVPAIYKRIVGSIISGINESGKYVYSRAEYGKNDPHVLTSLGIAGVRTSQGDYILNTIFKGSPADNAGLSDGDILVSANGAPLRNLSDMEILGLFNGFSSGTIKIRAIGANGKEKKATLRRASVIIADADVVIRNVSETKILEIIVHRISNNSVEIASDAIEKNKKEIGGVYLDLRNASGDDEMAMAKLAGLFLGEIPVARVTAASMEEIEIVPGGAAIIDVPVVVAVSNTTQGTAEGLTFAFWENSVGVIVGMPTAGRARLATVINLDNGGALEILNRVMRSGQNRTIDGRGFFPTVCLSNIRTSEQKDIFIINAKNSNWEYRDFNGDESIDPQIVRKGCPAITSGADEDNVAAAVAMDILLNPEVYKKLKAK